MDQINIHHIRPTVKVGLFNKASQLWDTEISFNKGERYLLVSQSGRGKTSVLSFIYGIRFDYTGMITIDGEDVRSFSRNRWSEVRAREMSILFQDLRLFNQLSARDNIRLKQEIGVFNGGPTVEEIASALELSPLMEKRCDTLSYGEQQRVAIIRSLVQPFDFLLMDEPFSHIDNMNTRKAIDLIDKACKCRGAALIFTSLGDNYGIDFDHVIEV